MERQIKKYRWVTFFFVLIVVTVSYLYYETALSAIGRFLVLDDTPEVSDAIVVLNTGVEYYSRLIEASDLFRKKFADRIIINGNRKTDVLRNLEKKGLEHCCLWYEDFLRVLELFDVPRTKLICISAEDAYDTVSEADVVGKELIDSKFKKVIITTSKYHTRRASFIWRQLFGDKLSIKVISAKTDPFDPDYWWHDGRQVKWVMAEYGSLVYLVWKNLTRGK